MGAQKTTELTADSGCTEILLKQSSAHLLQNREKCTRLKVTVANNQVITSIEKGTSKIPTKTDDIVLPTYVFKVDSLTNNLAGLSNLTNMGCSVILDSETISVIRDGEVIWSGTEGTKDKLWK
jgi:hypothetical protein